MALHPKNYCDCGGEPFQQLWLLLICRWQSNTDYTVTIILVIIVPGSPAFKRPHETDKYTRLCMVIMCIIFLKIKILLVLKQNM